MFRTLCRFIIIWLIMPMVLILTFLDWLVDDDDWFSAVPVHVSWASFGLIKL